MGLEGFLTIADKLQLKPYKSRPFKAIQYITEAELNANIGTTAIVDVELYKNFYIVSFKFIAINKYLVLESPFNPHLLSWILHNYLTVGFNSIKYDLPIIWKSYNYQDIPTLQKLSDALINGIWWQEAAKEFNFTVHPTNHIDLIEVAPLRGSLKLYGARIHQQRIQDLPFSPYEDLNDQQKAIVKDYNINDLDTTEALFKFMKERIELRHAMSQEYGENLLSKSDAQIAEAILNKEVYKINGSWPKKIGIQYGMTFYYQPPSYLQFQTPELQRLLDTIKNTKFTVNPSGKVTLPDELKVAIRIGDGYYRLGIGGLHSSEECIHYITDKDHIISDKDVTSYYPWLVLNLGLFPQSMGKAFLIAYRQIVYSRMADKEAKRTTAANGKKIVVNGAGGKFSDPFSTLYGPDLTIQMTVTGQLDLLLYIEMQTLARIKVISANTDGVVCYFHKDQEVAYQECGQRWQAITGFNLEETRYIKYYARDVNAYFAVKEGAKTIKDVKVKGPYSEIGSQSGTQLDTNPTAQICSDAVKQLLLDGTPIEKTILECKDFTRFVTVRQCKAPGAHKDGDYLGKVIRWYYAKDVIGTINYVESGNKVPDTDGAKPCMDLPESFPDDVDYMWYISKCREMLYDISYLERARQISFF